MIYRLVDKLQRLVDRDYRKRMELKEWIIERQIDLFDAYMYGQLTEQEYHEMLANLLQAERELDA